MHFISLPARLLSDLVDVLCMAFDGRAGIVDIDEDERTVIFDTYRLKKITGKDGTASDFDRFLLGIY